MSAMDTATLSSNENSTISFTLIVAVLVPTLYFYLLNDNRKSSSSSSSSSNNIPWAPGRIPVFGHALAYKHDPAQFLTNTCQTFGSMFQLNLAGKHMIVVCGPEEQKALATLPESQLSARQAVADIGFEQTLGHFNVHQGTDLHKGIVKGVWHKNPSQIVTGWMEQLQKAVFMETTTTTNNHNNHRFDFFQLIRRVVLRTVIDLMIAPTFVDEYPTFLDEFMSFQDQLEDVTAKSVVLPRWIALPAMLLPLERRRLKLQAKIAARLESLLNLEDVKKGFWLEEMLELKASQSSSTTTTTTTTKIDIPIISELIVGLLFAAHKNPAIGAAQAYLLLQEMGTQEDQDLCTKESHRFLQSPDYHTLQSCQRLRRLCLETLRLTAHSLGAVRTAQKDIPINVNVAVPLQKQNQQQQTQQQQQQQQQKSYVIPKGASISFAHIASSWNPEIWKDPHHLDTTNRSGELYQDEYKFTTFSHGVHKCPGQQLAMVILQCTLAILLHDYQITLPKDEDMPHLSFERATLAQRQGPVMVTMKPKA